MAKRAFVPLWLGGALLAVAAAGASAGPAPRVPRGSLPRPMAVHGRPGLPWSYGARPWRHRPWGGPFHGYYPAPGFWFSFLPFGCVSFSLGGMPYYYWDGVYYADGPSGGYVVVEPSEDMVKAREGAEPKAAGPDLVLDALLVVPKRGQSQEKMDADRAEARRYARERSRYDPACADPSDPGTPRARQAYLRALKAYLEERGYTVN